MHQVVFVALSRSLTFSAEPLTVASHTESSKTANMKPNERTCELNNIIYVFVL